MVKYFRPKEDITAYEVAYIFGHTQTALTAVSWGSGVQFDGDEWQALPDNMKRRIYIRDKCD